MKYFSSTNEVVLEEGFVLALIEFDIRSIILEVGTK